jgi:hypothetical protein
MFKEDRGNAGQRQQAHAAPQNKPDYFRGLANGKIG